jgi:hypothetical protein
MRGDALDVRGDTILAGSYHHDKQILSFSMRMGVEQSAMTLDEIPPVLVLATQYSKADDGAYFAFGGSGTNKLFVHNSDTYRLIAETDALPAPVFAIDWCDSRDEIAVGLGNGEVHIYNFS